MTAALLRGEVDAGLGRVHPTGLPGEETLACRLVRLEPVDVVLGAGHALAGRDAIRPAELGGGRLWCPASVDRLDFLGRFAEQFGVATESGVNLGLDYFVEQIAADPLRFSLFPADAPLPTHSGVRGIQLVAPTPLYAWSLVWSEQTRHPRLDVLLRGLARAGRRSRWLEYHPDRDWLPDHDRAELARLSPPAAKT